MIEKIITPEKKISPDDMTSFALKMRLLAKKYFSGETDLSDEDRGLLEYFTKVCFARKLSDVSLEKYSEMLQGGESWDALVETQAKKELSSEKLDELKKFLSDHKLFALSLVGNPEMSLPKNLQEKLTTTVRKNQNSKAVFEASHE